MSRTRRVNSTRRPAVLSIAVSMAMASCILAVGAQAQDTDPHATAEQAAKENDLDTDVTPVAKKSDLWTLVHGAEYKETEVIPGSATSFDTDLFDVSFRTRALGLAGGSACAVEPMMVSGETPEQFGDRVSSCESPSGESVVRVPALYRYHEPADDDPRWDRLTLPGNPTPGYIGSIAWVDSQRALIVGGTGTYPRREPAADGKDPTDPTKADPAGKARAWLYHRSSDSVEELDLSSFTGDEPNRAGMRGFSAVACYQDPLPGKKIELCFAGALGQMWEWRDGRFNGKHVDAASPEEDLEHANEFRYRVRDIKFPDIPPASEIPPPVAAAVTSGCCASNPAENAPAILSYYEKHIAGRDGSDPVLGGPRWFAREYEPRGVDFEAVPVDSPADSLRVGRPEAPDSLYSLTVSSTTGTSERAAMFNAAVVASAGGTSGPEAPSVISGSKAVPMPGYQDGGLIGGTLRAAGLEEESNDPPVGAGAPEPGSLQVATGRLVTGSGDVATADGGRPSTLGDTRSVTFPSRPTGPDGVADWAAGELRSTRIQNLGAQGLVVATALAPTLREGVARLLCGKSSTDTCFAPTPEELTSGDYEPVDQQKLEAYRRSQHFLLPSYSVNSVEIVGAQEDGWMVGDHGAILRLSAQVVQATEAASEPKPPRLGSSREQSLSDRDPYGAQGSELPSRAGVVPSLGAETVEADEIEMATAGSVGGSVEAVVMSRDGSEGWAIGNSGGATFSYYDGATWKPCDPVGVENVVEPDPACEAMAPLRGYRDSTGNLRTTSLTHAVRIPLENDDDPSNDDELEILAVGGNYLSTENGGQTSPAIARYKNGRWRFEDTAALDAFADTSRHDFHGLAFAAPDDGWAVTRYSTNLGARFYHFDGERWRDCGVDPASCGNAEGVLPTRLSQVGGLTVASERIFLFGLRPVGGDCVATGICPNRDVPLILYRDPGGEWTDGSGEAGDGAGFDPGFTDPATEEAGSVESLSVVEGPDGYEGWAVGVFGPSQSPTHALLRLDPGSERGWQGFNSRGAFDDYMLPGTRLSGSSTLSSAPRLMASNPSGDETGGVFIGQEPDSQDVDGGRIFAFDSERQRFQLLESGRPTTGTNVQFLGRVRPLGRLQTMAPDGQAGFWAAVSGQMLHYTKRPPKPVFEEVPNPFSTRGVNLRALAGGADGSVWAATSSDRLYRYDRIAGWEEARVPGWDPGRVVTRASAANAIAIGPDGEGVVVGEAGRIANLSSTGIGLDPAAGRSCALGDAAPCSTSRDLTAVDIAPDGSAIAAGQRLSLLWRPPGGDFRAIERPPIASATEITGVSFPTPTRAYLATDRGALFSGEMSGAGEWKWRVDNRAGDHLLSIDRLGKGIPLRDVAVDAAGSGYAVGDSGLLMRRTANGGWTRLPTSFPHDLTAVELGFGGGESALIGGANGLILTASGENIEPARQADFRGASIAGFAYLPGSSEGSVDAWAGLSSGLGANGDSRLLRYRSDRDDPRLDPSAAARALPDTPAAVAGELSLGAFGKSDCDVSTSELCPEMSGTTTTNELIAKRIIEELADRRASGGLDLTIQTGDATDSAGLPASSAADLDRKPGPGVFTLSNTQRAGQLKHRRYVELVADELADREVPLFAAVGGQDLSETFVCRDETCNTTKQVANGGENLSWREAFVGRPDPWGTGEDMLDDSGEGEIEIEPVRGSAQGSIRTEDQEADLDGDGPAPQAKADIGGASTHYALDATRDGEVIARIVFVDSSMRSLAASDPQQQPKEQTGQQAWLERMICREGERTQTGERCTREKDQAAIVVSNTPPYSYGAGALTHTATDANIFEALLLEHRVDLLITGALGYNGLYYTLAPGLHEPCPGESYPERPPSGQTPDCAGAATDATGQGVPAEIPDPASLLAAEGLAGKLPVLIASGAGGKFGPDGTGGADGPAGQWHGYSVARLLPGGDLVVEQRPILDWVGMDASRHVIRPREKLLLRGYGRSPISTTTRSVQTRAFHYEISNAAITHRYDLLRADPERPWLPLEDAGAGAQADGAENCEDYVCLPTEVATVDSQSGEVKAGSGKHPPTYAIAMLSVADKVTTYPLFFEPSPSFRFEAPSAPRPTPTVAGVAAPGSPAAPTVPQIPNVSVPTPPVPPALVPPPPAPPATPPQPPVPPPVPPADAGPSALSLSFAPTGLVVAPTASVIPPPAPPINPAPPGGARKEARQRQAATQKSGADGAEGDSQNSQVDPADSPDGPPGSAMTRLQSDPARQEYSFTRLEQRDENSPALLWGVGLTLAALALATGFSTLRPRSHRREPEIPAPAYRRNI